MIVYTGELSVHSERMASHVNGMVTKIHAYKNSIQILAANYRKMVSGIPILLS